jgi:hypothetical protein
MGPGYDFNVTFGGEKYLIMKIVFHLFSIIKIFFKILHKSKYVISTSLITIIINPPCRVRGN